MPLPKTGVSESAPRKHVRQYFHEVLDSGVLPPLPAVVVTGLKLVRNPDIDFQQLSRVLTNDAALATRILRLTRSALYGLHSAPNSLEHALPVIGLQELQRVLITAGIQRLCRHRSKMSKPLWNHALATALTAEMLARHTPGPDLHQAFLGGLLHDIGQLVLLHGDPTGFEDLMRVGQSDADSVPCRERKRYGTDHTVIGSMLLDYWELDLGIEGALVHHHDDAVAAMEPASLAALLCVADYVAGLAGYTFVGQPSPSPLRALDYWSCRNKEARGSLIEQIRQATALEMSLYS